MYLIPRPLDLLLMSLSPCTAVSRFLYISDKPQPDLHWYQLLSINYLFQFFFFCLHNTYLVNNHKYVLQNNIFTLFGFSF
ncbi:hypothetical protein J3Q64DRAFT_1733415 [Phycomyces blakesleeanus]|uniref:Uncharacterized protein n=1 Tax=Phycomyces blakesleeanus TaxID=4837 RepID=A0ABR3B1U7_PHYBL